ncbi:MAG: 1,4-alpha-glucan branching protein GlgB [Gemmatimonadaceae bacterium]|nr:1,4-alpha-glucan branching protein GlgB [Gemmatimonadaceae bacterium]
MRCRGRSTQGTASGTLRAGCGVPTPTRFATRPDVWHRWIVTPTPAQPAPSVAGKARHDVTLLDDTVVHLFNEGTLDHAHRVLGAHLHAAGGMTGTYFAVWAPDARTVSVVADFNEWDRTRHPMKRHGASGIWEVFIPGVGAGAHYKYHVVGRTGGYRVDKADPYGVWSEVPPKTASIVWDLAYEWGDATWMAARRTQRVLERPMSIYEVHLGSWMRVTEERNRSMTYREIAGPLADYVERMGFTHVELMPVMEHPYYGSWGYQVTGYFAATSRYGTPQDLMYLVDTLHQRGIGVIFDWVPSHFPTDAHGLSYFDGTHLYEHADPRKGYHPDWGSYVFNYGRYEVQNFLRSNAQFWLETYHADGLRVDAVASMLHLDFSRKEGEWIPNKYGGNENLEAVDFLRRLNEGVYRDHPDAVTIAEDSTAWPLVSRPVYVGGLGFGMKWDMGWMHDSLAYFALDPIHRRFHHQKVTFRMMYAFAENYVLSLSHDEVVHMKGSLLHKMAGDEWQQRANLRCLLGWMYGQPGKKLLFMGCEFGQRAEWNHERSLDWHLLQYADHQGLQRWVTALNTLYRDVPAMHERDTHADGFSWVDCSDADQGVVSFLRYGVDRSQPVLAVYNFTPVPRRNYRIGVPASDAWDEVLNSDDRSYGGSGMGNGGRAATSDDGRHGHPCSIVLTLPPLAVLFLRPVPGLRVATPPSKGSAGSAEPVPDESVADENVPGESAPDEGVPDETAPTDAS